MATQRRSFSGQKATKKRGAWGRPPWGPRKSWQKGDFYKKKSEGVRKVIKGKNRRGNKSICTPAKGTQKTSVGEIFPYQTQDGRRARSSPGNDKKPTNSSKAVVRVGG